MTEKESLTETMEKIKALIEDVVKRPVYYKRQHDLSEFDLDGYLFFVKESRRLLGFIPFMVKKELCKLDFTIHRVIILDDNLSDIKGKIVTEIRQHAEAWKAGYLKVR